MFVTLDQDGFWWGKGLTKAASLKSAQQALKKNPWDGVRFKSAIPCHELSYKLLKDVENLDKDDFVVKRGIFYLVEALEIEREKADQQTVTLLGNNEPAFGNAEFDALGTDDKLKVLYRLIKLSLSEQRKMKDRDR